MSRLTVLSAQSNDEGEVSNVAGEVFGERFSLMFVENVFSVELEGFEYEITKEAVEATSPSAHWASVVFQAFFIKGLGV